MRSFPASSRFHKQVSIQTFCYFLMRSVLSSLSSPLLICTAPINQPEAALLGIVQPRFCVQRRAMLLPMLGPSLDEVLHAQRHARGTRQTAFSLRTVALIAAQTVPARFTLLFLLCMQHDMGTPVLASTCSGEHINYTAAVSPRARSLVRSRTSRRQARQSALRPRFLP